MSGQPYFLQLDVVENHSDGGIAGVQGASGTPSVSPLIGYVNTAGEDPLWQSMNSPFFCRLPDEAQ